MQQFIGSLCTWIERRVWCLQPKKRERKKKEKKRKRLLSFAFSSVIKFRYLDSYRKLPKSSLGIPCLHQWHALSGSPVARTVINTATIMNHGGKAKLALRQIMEYNLRCRGKKDGFPTWKGSCWLCNGYVEPFLPRNDVCNIKYMFFKGHNNQEKQILIFFLFLCPCRSRLHLF